MKFNGKFMSKDTVVADIVDGIVVPINEKLLPLHLKNHGAIEGWLEGRAIDAHRTNSRLLKKALRLAAADDTEVVLNVNAATITDTYWVKPEGSNLTYDDIRFKHNMFDKLALYGDPDSLNNGYGRTPELTNIGSFEKCWRLIGNEWWIYKQGNELELFSELFICELGKAMGFSMAHYEKSDKYIRSKDFTRGASVNYEPASGIVGDNEDYITNYEALKRLSANCTADYIKMIYLDTLCFNMDRHTNNYGVLRDVDSGDILGMSPNFDNNIALISNGYPQNIKRKNDLLIRLFIEFLEGDRCALAEFKNIGVPIINRGIIEACMTRVPVETDREFICEFILNGQELIASPL